LLQYAASNDTAAASRLTLWRNNVNVTSENNTNVVLGVGTWYYVANSTLPTANYSWSPQSSTVTVNKKGIFIAMLPATEGINYGDTRTQYCAGNSSTYQCTLWRNEANVTSANNTSPTLGAGTWNYKANVTAPTANYSWTANTSTLTVNAVSATLVLYLNGSSSNITVERNWVVNITAAANNAQGTIYLYNNSVLITSCSLASTCSNVEAHPANVNSQFNITANYPETQNYSAVTSTSYWIKINNTIPSVPNLLTPTNGDYTAVNTTAFD
jgi:hypothetical protein